MYHGIQTYVEVVRRKLLHEPWLTSGGTTLPRSDISPASLCSCMYEIFTAYMYLPDSKIKDTGSLGLAVLRRLQRKARYPCQEFVLANAIARVGNEANEVIPVQT
jgi:hypothetical protein